MFDVSVRVWYNHDHGGDRERIVKVESLQKFDNCLLEERASGDFLKKFTFSIPRDREDPIDCDLIRGKKIGNGLRE